MCSFRVQERARENRATQVAKPRVISPAHALVVVRRSVQIDGLLVSCLKKKDVGAGKEKVV